MTHTIILHPTKKTSINLPPIFSSSASSFNHTALRVLSSSASLIAIILLNHHTRTPLPFSALFIVSRNFNVQDISHDIIVIQAYHALSPGQAKYQNFYVDELMHKSTIPFRAQSSPTHIAFSQACCTSSPSPSFFPFSIQSNKEKNHTSAVLCRCFNTALIIRL